MRVEVEFYRSEDASMMCSCHGTRPKAGMLSLLATESAMFEVCEETLDVLETMELHEENARQTR